MYDQRPSGDDLFYQGLPCSWSKSSCAIEQGEASDASLQQRETAATPMALGAVCSVFQPQLVLILMHSILCAALYGGW